MGGPAVAGLDPLLFLSCRSGGRRKAQGPMLSWVGGPWRFGKGWHLAERERLASTESWQAEGRKRQVQASRAAESDK